MKAHSQTALAALILVVVIATITYFSGHTQTRDQNPGPSNKAVALEKRAPNENEIGVVPPKRPDEEQAKVADSTLLFLLGFLICGLPGIALLILIKR